LRVLGDAQPQQQYDDAEQVRHVARQAENVHAHDSIVGWLGFFLFLLSLLASISFLSFDIFFYYY